jgi:hypothetical protein
MRVRTYGGLLVTALLFLLALGQSSARAEGNFKVEGVNITGTTALQSEVDGDAKFLVTVAFVTVAEVLCKKNMISEGSLFVGGTSLMTLEFAECTTFVKKAESPACKAVEPIRLKAKGKLILNGGKTYELMEPDAGSSFGVLKFGEECALGTSMEIKGSFVFEDCSFLGFLEVEAVKHLLSIAPSIGTDVFGAVSLDFSLWFKLGGEKAGKKWSGLA